MRLVSVKATRVLWRVEAKPGKWLLEPSEKKEKHRKEIPNDGKN
jgi:hypothetical protein